MRTATTECKRDDDALNFVERLMQHGVRQVTLWNSDDKQQWVISWPDTGRVAA
jgi:hypothetical protein